MEAAEEKKLKYWLRHIDEPGHTPECNRRTFCPKGADCGECRLQYMKKRGWLK